MLQTGDGRSVIEGPAFSSQDEFNVTYREKSLYVIDSSGIIERVVPPSSDEYVSIRGEASRLGCLTSLREGQYLLQDSSTCMCIPRSGPRMAQLWTSL